MTLLLRLASRPPVGFAHNRNTMPTNRPESPPLRPLNREELNVIVCAKLKASILSSIVTRLHFMPKSLCAVALLSAVTLFAAEPLHIPFKEYKLDNGLRVILSEDHTAPSYSVSVTYDVGSRDEKPGRTGFAHLFEHMMYQGSENVGK